MPPSAAPNPPLRPPEVDCSEWPLVRIAFFGADPSYVDPFIRSMLTLAQRGPFVTLADARRAGSIGAAMRRRLFNGFARVHATGNWRAETIVMDNPVLRGIATAYSWVRRDGGPLKVCATMEEAEAWLREVTPSVVGPGASRSP